jgi:toluene monooxygenase system ferredoxin subunit
MATAVKLCSISDLPIRGGRLFEGVAKGLDLLVFRLDDGSIVAYDAACPHVGAQLRPENEMRGVLTCTVHQWRFEIERGDGLDGVPCALVAHAVDRRNGELWVMTTPMDT